MVLFSEIRWSSSRECATEAQTTFIASIKRGVTTSTIKPAIPETGALFNSIIDPGKKEGNFIRFLQSDHGKAFTSFPLPLATFLAGVLYFVDRNLNTLVDEINNNLNARVDSLERGLNGRMDSFERRIDALDHHLDKRLDDVNQSINRLYTLFSGRPPVNNSGEETAAPTLPIPGNN